MVQNHYTIAGANAYSFSGGNGRGMGGVEVRDIRDLKYDSLQNLENFENLRIFPIAIRENDVYTIRNWDTLYYINIYYSI